MTDIELNLKTGLPGRKDEESGPKPVLCQICSAKTVPGLDLGHQPIGDYVLSEQELNEPSILFPLKLHHCYDCGLTQLSYIAPPEEVYKGFPFVSGTTKTATNHLQSLPRQLVELMNLDESSFAVDIGSNDGTLLKGYLPYGVKFLGVDPSGDPVRIANEQGLTTLHTFFNPETAEYIRTEFAHADAITACGVFAHIDNLAGVMEGVKILLAPNGVFATDSQYWLDTMARGYYDNVFHQHLRYYAMKPLIHLFKQYGMDVFDVERSEVYGGSIRVFSCNEGAYPISQRVSDLITVEEEARLYEPETNEAFARSIEQRRMKFFNEIYSRKVDGKRVIGVGAPAKASTVCNYCGVGPELLDYITEVNPLRIGKYLPGVHIPIIEEEIMFNEAQPADAAVLFAWNYHKEIMPKLRERGFTGEIILP
jgi:SAM-dependent methyltransferase